MVGHLPLEENILGSNPSQAAKLQSLRFPACSGGYKERVWRKEFCPPSLFRRRRISYFASQNAPQGILPLPHPSHARATNLLPYSLYHYNTTLPNNTTGAIMLITIWLEYQQSLVKT